MNLSVQFKHKEIFNTDNLSRLGIVIINDLTFNIIIYIWYLLVDFNIITSVNVFFAIMISLIQNIIIFIYLISKNISIEYIIKYFILLIILKILPIISLYNNNKIYINYIDVYITVYLYLVYVLIFFIIYDVVLEKNIGITSIVNKDLTGSNITNDDNLLNSIYDTTYNDIIKRII